MKELNIRLGYMPHYCDIIDFDDANPHYHELNVFCGNKWKRKAFTNGNLSIFFSLDNLGIY